MLINGKEYALQAPVTLEQLLLELGYRTKLVAVERNNSIVKRAAYASTVLSDAD
ncbi:MAG: sulfur carrier protein ThiS [Phascolarctobacterium sp.]